MRNYLATITLNKDYAGPTVDSSELSDLDNWNGLIGTTSIVKSALSFYYKIIPGTINSAIVSDGLNSPFGIGSEYGLEFRISFDVLIENPGSNPFNSFQIFVNSQPSSGLIIATSPIYSGYQNNALPHHIEFEFNSSSFAIGEVRINVVRSGAVIEEVEYTFTNMLIEAINNDSEFDTGDQLLIYYNDSDDGIEVDHQYTGTLDVDISEGPDLGVLLDNQIGYVDPVEGSPNSKKSHYAFCVGDDRVEFWTTKLNPSFPYFNKKIIYNSSFCVPAIVCNINFNLPALILSYPTSAYSQNGSFQVFASTSHDDIDHPIKYSLQSPEDATYQSLGESNGGIFTGVGLGEYIVYAYDQYNCVANYRFVFILSTDDYNTIYRQEFKDIQSLIQVRLDINQLGYNGKVNDEISDGNNPLELSKLSGDINNKFGVIRETNSIISLISKKSLAYIGLFSQTDRKNLSIYENPVGSEVWRGYITPSQYGEPYKSIPYPVSITSTDGLAILKDEPFVDISGNNLVGRMSLISILVVCLDKLGLTLGIRSSINKYASGFNTGVNDDPLDQTFIDVACFYDEDDVPIKCDNVLESILKPFGAEIIQYGGWWNIVEVESKTASYNYRTFTSAGVKIVGGNGTFDPIISIVSPLLGEGVLFANQDAQLEIIPAYGKIVITRELRTKVSLLGRSLDKAWQANLLYATAAYITYFDENTEDLKVISNGSIVSSSKPSKYKGLSINNIDATFGQKVIHISDVFYFTTQKDALKLSFDYQHLLSQAYALIDEDDPILPVKVVDPKWVKLKWTLYLIVDDITYKYSERIGWNTLTNDIYVRNEIVIDKFDREFKSFDKTIDLPSFTVPQQVGIRLLFEFNGGYYEDFNSLSGLTGIPTGTLPLNYKVKGRISGVFKYFYLRLATGSSISDDERDYIHDNPGNNPLPEDENNPYLRVVPNDYADPNNIVIWQEDSVEGLVIPMDRIDLKSVVLSLMPNKKNPIKTETITSIINEGYKENLPVELFLGDHPSSIIQKEIYTNYFTDVSGSPTYAWSRAGFSESTSIQQILMKQMVNQYVNPTWKLSGSFVDPDNVWGFLNTIKSTIPPIIVSVPDPEFNFGFDDPTNYWQNFGAIGIDWIHKGVVEFNGDDDSKYLVTTETVSIPSGSRVSVAFKVIRTGTTLPIRTDSFLIVLFNSGVIVQVVSGIDAMAYDDTFEKTVKFNTVSDSDNIGFFIKNVDGEDGVANYQVDYFRLSGQTVVRYFGVNSLTKNDRHNNRQAELYQLIPAILSTNPEYDDSGNGDTNPGDSGGNGGGNFSGDYSNDYSGDFDNILA